MHGVSVVMPWAGAMGFAIMGNAGPTLGVESSGNASCRPVFIGAGYW